MTEAYGVAVAKLEGRYGSAQQAEAAAHEAHDQAGVDRAKAEQVAALDELHALREAKRAGAELGTVVLICPNPNANLTDSNGVTFVDGRAEGVPRPLARKYAEDHDGYTTEETA